MSHYYRISKKTCKVIGTNLNCPPLPKLAKNAEPYSVAPIPHNGKVFFVPEEVWEAWKEAVQRDLRPRDFMQ